MKDAPGLPLPVAMLLESAIGAGLALDADTRARLTTLEGKVVRLEVREPALDIVLIVNGGRVRVPSVHDGEVDVTIRGTARAIASLAKDNDALHRGDVTIRGEVGLGQAMRTLLAGIDPEWQEWLAPVLGDTLVHRLDRLLGTASAWWTRSRAAFGDNTRDWLEDEAGLLASPVQLERFADEVDGARASVDRLAARLARLERRSSGDEGSVDVSGGVSGGGVVDGGAVDGDASGEPVS